jgi:hypothetical protein
MSLGTFKEKGKFGEYKGYQLLESQIRYAMANTTSNSEAAKWLHVSFPTWKKYAKMYIDSETGKSLYDLHKEHGSAQRSILPQTRYRRRASAPWAFQPYDMQEIFANKYPTYSKTRFKERLIKEGYIVERCSCCGFQERRQYDYEVPLKMHFLDGNSKNFALENIELLCYNCYFLNVGNPVGKNRAYTIDDTTGEPVPVHDGNRKYLTAEGFPMGPLYQDRQNEMNNLKK